MNWGTARLPIDSAVRLRSGRPVYARNTDIWVEPFHHGVRIAACYVPCEAMGIRFTGFVCVSKWIGSKGEGDESRKIRGSGSLNVFVKLLFSWLIFVNGDYRILDYRSCDKAFIRITEWYVKSLKDLVNPLNWSDGGEYRVEIDVRIQRLNEAFGILRGLSKSRSIRIEMHMDLVYVQVSYSYQWSHASRGL